MSYCTNCGTYIPIGEQTCPSCGAAAHFNAGTARQAVPGQEPKQEAQYVRQEQPAQSWEPWKQDGSTSGSYNASQSSYTGASSGSYNASQDCNPVTGETADHRLSALCYVGPLFLFPLLMHKSDPFVRFHSNQGLLLFLLEALILNCFDGLIGAAGFVFCLYCVVKGVQSAASGRRDKLPLIGNINLIK